MAQPFSLRHPLIDFHGNYGSPDFGAAAERYTECRLSPLAMRLLARHRRGHRRLRRQLRRRQSTSRRCCPARFPNLLVNGSQGIAVGMATNIPPHNLGEVIDATVHLIDNPDATPDDLMQFVKGPDFPTGGLILGRAGIIDAYRTGRGSMRMRARAEIEEIGKRGDRFQIVVTEMPYQVVAAAPSWPASPSWSTAASSTASPTSTTSRPTDGHPAGHRAQARRQRQRRAQQPVQAHAAADELRVNMVALVDGVPRTLNLVQALQAYVDHQVEVITRRSRVPAEQGAGPGPHRRGPAQGARHDRRRSSP